jgi:hypothetical protein
VSDGSDWQTEQVRTDLLRIGDIFKHGDDWLTVIDVREAGESQPDWDRELGDRVFVCETFDDRNRRHLTFAYDRTDEIDLVVRRKVEF